MADLNSSIHGMGIVWEALLRLVKLPGSNWEALTRFFQQIINDPFYRKNVFAVLAGCPQMVTRKDWVEREGNVLTRLTELGIPVINPPYLEGQWQEGFTKHHRFLPDNLSRQQLLEACQKAGLQIYGNNPDLADAMKDELPTETGVLECDLGTIMVPTDAQHRPFLLLLDEQIKWAKEQGGDGILSAEETLYLLLRAWVELGKIPFMGGVICCRNADSLGVSWRPGIGLRVGHCNERDTPNGRSNWLFGAVPRKFFGI
ncbi:hypothetical protein HYW31_01725 [Candidatus Berkelbacteria bacterium]|nr:hypothetical protein [Candidatus Berkelbacteria bacterium]